MAKEQEPKKEVVLKSGHSTIFEALAAFQGELKSIPKTKEVTIKSDKGSYSFKYAPLDEILDTIYKLLGKHGLSFHHVIEKDGVECVITHESSELKKIETSRRTRVADEQEET